MEIGYELDEKIKELDVIHKTMGVPPKVFFIEECSEAIKEFMKKERGREDTYAIIDEVCDVILTSLMVLRGYGVDDSHITNMMMHKCTRAIEQWKLSNQTNDVIQYYKEDKENA